jgi:hypothetical protein
VSTVWSHTYPQFLHDSIVRASNSQTLPQHLLINPPFSPAAFTPMGLSIVPDGTFFCQTSVLRPLNRSCDYPWPSAYQSTELLLPNYRHDKISNQTDITDSKFSKKNNQLNLISSRMSPLLGLLASRLAFLFGRSFSAAISTLNCFRVLSHDTPPMPRIKPAPFVRVLAGQRAAARTRSVPAQFIKQATENNDLRIDSKEDVTKNTWTEFRTRRAAVPPAKADKEGPNPSDGEADLTSKRKAEWKRRQGVCV